MRMAERSPKRTVTLRDVASKVGVHPSTVSRVLNSDTRDMVSREVAAKVTKAADELGYNLNPFARSLKTNQSFTIGVLIPDLTDPLFPPIIRGIEDTLSGYGYTAIMANSDNDQTHERMSFDAMKARKVDGFILATAHRSDELVDQSLEEGIPLVLVNRQVDTPSVPSVVNDDAAGLRILVDHVAGLGHRRIAHIAGPQSLSTGFTRYNGFVNAMRGRGLSVREEDIVVADVFTEEGGYRAAKAIFENGTDITAVVTANDMLALGCFDALQELGIRCPEDVSVTGLNDIPFVSKITPALTTVRIQHFEMGEEAAKLLMRLIKNEDVGQISIVLKPELIIRDSTAPPPDPA